MSVGHVDMSAGHVNTSAGHVDGAAGEGHEVYLVGLARFEDFFRRALEGAHLATVVYSHQPMGSKWERRELGGHWPRNAQYRPVTPRNTSGNATYAG